QRFGIDTIVFRVSPLAIDIAAIAVVRIQGDRGRVNERLLGDTGSERGRRGIGRGEFATEVPGLHEIRDRDRDGRTAGNAGYDRRILTLPGNQETVAGDQGSR